MNLFRRNIHLADATLLLLLEGDLRGRTLRHSERHLSTCSECRMRRFALMEANAQISTGQPDLQGAPAARNRLAARLSQEVEASGSGRPASLPMFQASMLLRVAAVVALLALAVAWRQFDLPLQDRMAAFEETGPEPDHALTPGSTNPVALTQLCGLSDTDLDPRLSPEIERAVFRSYGISEHAARAYQVDYLINPQLGGNDHMENLWPEPYHATVWNARAKDALEARLHGMVCNGQIDLQAAQGELSTDWIAAYKKYFHTQRPVSTVAELDRPRMGEVPLP
jgi:hypothetical protein